MTGVEELAAFLSSRAFALLAAKRHSESIEAIDAAIHFTPHIEAYRIIKSIILRQIARANMPKVQIPPDPVLHFSGDEAEWAARRVEIMSAARRGIDPFSPDPLRDLQRRVYPNAPNSGPPISPNSPLQSGRKFR